MNNNVLQITNDNFENAVIKSNIPVLVDFWAPWCGPCKMLSPIVDELAINFAGKLKVGKVNVDEQQQLANKFKVMSIPTVFIFKNGNVIEKISGFKPKQEFEKILRNIL